uniref:Uncharacterized protein n=1 Tax=Hyaloperonospora arabidopsidis (strain Emoy2) TaxID=559515 RepID=M4BDQ1_HYAAE
MEGFLDGYKAKWRLRTSPSRSFDKVGLHAFLKGYAAADLRSVARVVKCRALQGIRHQDLVQAASIVPIRPNCADTLAAVDEWKVISANWSTRLVSSVLAQAGVSIGTIETMQIIGNARCVNEARLKRADMQPTVIYVGDSANDVLAMLEADVGIWLVVDDTASSLLGQLVKAYSIDVRPLMTDCSIAECATIAACRPTVFTMTDWAQLQSDGAIHHVRLVQ